MAFHSENSMSGMGHVAHQPCLYSAVNPYPYCSVAPNQNLYTTESGNLQIYAKQLMMQRLATASVYGQTLYPQRSPAIGSNSSNDLYMFPSVATTLNAGYQQTYGSKVQSSPMTTDYTRILDASNQLKCPKPAHPFYWRKRGNSVPAEGMTRTKDKYRVVYTDKQRVGLEKEFKINKFITMQRKTELSKELDLSERQVSVFFFFFFFFFFYLPLVFWYLQGFHMYCARAKVFTTRLLNSGQSSPNLNPIVAVHK